MKPQGTQYHQVACKVTDIGGHDLCMQTNGQHLMGHSTRLDQGAVDELEGTRSGLETEEKVELMHEALINERAGHARVEEGK